MQTIECWSRSNSLSYQRADLRMGVGSQSAISFKKLANQAFIFKNRIVLPVSLHQCLRRTKDLHHCTFFGLPEGQDGVHT